MATVGSATEYLVRAPRLFPQYPPRDYYPTFVGTGWQRLSAAFPPVVGPAELLPRTTSFRILPMA